MFIRNPLNYDHELASAESGLACQPPSMTQQQFKEECDINTIVQRFGVTGQLPVTTRMPSYGDFSGVSSYQDALNLVRASGEAFMGLASGVRSRFDNDPGKLLAFLADEANRDEAVKLGLVGPPPSAKPSSEASA